LPTPKAVSTRVWAKDDSVLVYVPAGAFWMGSTEEDIDAILPACSACEREWYTDEQPQHQVTLDAFWIDRTEVTNAQYRRCVEDGACSEPITTGSSTRENYYGHADFDSYPVIFVDWEQASAYCTWAGKRLPTEAEWEKAARGTDRRIYPWGDVFDGNLLNFCDANCQFDWKAADWDDGYADTAPVGSYLDGASPYGVLDMAGNVWEWTSSLDSSYPYDARDGREDLEAHGRRVVRGGSWGDLQWFPRSADRDLIEPSSWYNVIGFRCARSGSEP
jgi:serine/threonine-protein kinase